MIKKWLSKVISGSLILFSTIMLYPVAVDAASEYWEMYSSKNKSGWVYDNIYFPCTGGYVKSWNYYDEDGNPKDGWFVVDGKWYYGDEMHEDDYCGIYTNEWAPEYYNYYVDSSHVLHDYWGAYDSYCGSDGAAKTGWFQAYKQSDYGHKQGLKWFYADSNGKIYRNSYTPDGYWVDADGVCS